MEEGYPCYAEICLETLKKIVKDFSRDSTCLTEIPTGNLWNSRQKRHYSSQLVLTLQVPKGNVKIYDVSVETQ
jgi:hypothetical protein